MALNVPERENGRHARGGSKRVWTAAKGLQEAWIGMAESSKAVPQDMGEHAIPEVLEERGGDVCGRLEGPLDDSRRAQGSWTVSCAQIHYD